MKKERKDNSFIKKPEYLGGVKAMKEFIAKHKKYPKEAADNNIEGTVSIRYTINHEGKVIDTKIISGLGYGCDEEAERLVKKLKFHVEKVRGLRVTFKKDLHIHFRKPKLVKKPIPLKPNAVSGIQYQYAATKKKKADVPKERQKSGYSYTIQIRK